MDNKTAVAPIVASTHHNTGQMDDVINRLAINDDIYHIRGERIQLFLKRDFLSAAECEEMIAIIERVKRPSTVMGSSPDPNYRTSDSASIGYENDPIVAEIDARINTLTGIDPVLGERLEGQCYIAGTQFKPHCDYFYEEEPYWPEQVLVGGQRTWTVIVYLNAPEAGGGTTFTRAGIRLSPRAGNLLAWCNLDEAGLPNEFSMHCGEPVESGVKYLMTKWHRERAFTPEAAILSVPRRFYGVDAS